MTGPGRHRPWPDADESTESADTVATVPIEMEGDGPLVVRQKVHAAAPMTIDQALFEMELVGHDFYLFRDKESGCSSVVYRRCGYRYGVIRLVEDPGSRRNRSVWPLPSGPRPAAARCAGRPAFARTVVR